MKLTPTQGWRSTISRRVSEREIRRRVIFSNLRRSTARHDVISKYVRGHVPIIYREFFAMMIGALITFWIAAVSLSFLFHVSALYTYAVLGLVYSIQATYYKYRLSTDPNYKIPKCRCNARQNENMEKVLKSSESAILRVPNSLLAVLFYSALIIANYFGRTDMLVPIALLAFCASAYLTYVMVTKIGSLCANCINISALNILILLQLLL